MPANKASTPEMVIQGTAPRLSPKLLLSVMLMSVAGAVTVSSVPKNPTSGLQPRPARGYTA
ncbi:hypothetical protein KTH_62430 [Thermosporothrix hazakensis]|nr:hypothetical protein KTH_62430 [Thermosporothrix hazakensis]